MDVQNHLKSFVDKSIGVWLYINMWIKWKYNDHAHPGSARDMSYQVGVQLALYDELMKNRNEPV